jgi:hypothetical protein
MEAAMTTPKPEDTQGRQQEQGGSEQRSENLLPADDAGDGRYDVAEEVNLDQQGDMARRVGQAPKGIASDALADTLKDQDKPGATS